MQVHIILDTGDLDHAPTRAAYEALLAARRPVLERDGGEVVTVPVVAPPPVSVEKAPPRRRKDKLGRKWLGGRKPKPLTRQQIDDAIADCGGNRNSAAKFLGVSPVTMRRHMVRLGGYHFDAVRAGRGPLLSTRPTTGDRAGERQQEEMRDVG